MKEASKPLERAKTSIIYLAAQAGMWLDSHYQTDKRLFTAFCTIAGVGISLWVVLRQLKRFNSE
ncbi:MAG: AtpZ/AtpI family protein [Robiginitalea sp.]